MTNSINDSTTRHERLVALHAAESDTLTRNLMIRLSEPINTSTKAGRPITYMVWKYLNPLHDQSDWKTRKSPMSSKETKLVLDSGPYEEEALYRVTAQKNKGGFWTWTKIEGLEPNTQDLDTPA